MNNDTDAKLTLLELVGETIRDAILAAASLLKQGFVPGLVSLALVVALIILLVWYWQWCSRRNRALNKVVRYISRVKGEEDFLEKAQDLDSKFYNIREKGLGPEKAVATAWKEYRETTIEGPRAQDERLRNAIRPSLFFNLEDLGFTSGGWRPFPGLFVSIGLALTFLGLISALDQTAESLRVRPESS